METVFTGKRFISSKRAIVQANPDPFSSGPSPLNHEMKAKRFHHTDFILHDCTVGTARLGRHDTAPVHTSASVWLAPTVVCFSCSRISIPVQEHHPAFLVSSLSMYGTGFETLACWSVILYHIRKLFIACGGNGTKSTTDNSGFTYQLKRKALHFKIFIDIEQKMYDKLPCGYRNRWNNILLRTIAS